MNRSPFHFDFYDADFLRLSQLRNITSSNHNLAALDTTRSLLFPFCSTSVYTTIICGEHFILELSGFGNSVSHPLNCHLSSFDISANLCTLSSIVSSTYEIPYLVYFGTLINIFLLSFICVILVWLLETVNLWSRNASLLSITLSNNDMLHATTMSTEIKYLDLRAN